MWTVPLPCLMTGGFKHSPVAPSPTFPIPFKYHPKSGRSWMFWRQGSSVVMRLKIVFFSPHDGYPFNFHSHPFFGVHEQLWLLRKFIYIFFPEPWKWEDFRNLWKYSRWIDYKFKSKKFGVVHTSWPMFTWSIPWHIPGPTVRLSRTFRTCSCIYPTEDCLALIAILFDIYLGPLYVYNLDDQSVTC